MQLFQNDDVGYLTWKAENPLGFVLVSHNPPVGTYTTLHRADCGSLNPHDAASKNWTVLYIKACSGSRAELEQWAVTELAAVATPCGLCVQAGRL